MRKPFPAKEKIQSDSFLPVAPITRQLTYKLHSGTANEDFKETSYATSAKSTSCTSNSNQNHLDIEWVQADGVDVQFESSTVPWAMEANELRTVSYQEAKIKNSRIKYTDKNFGNIFSNMGKPGMQSNHHQILDSKSSTRSSNETLQNQHISSQDGPSLYMDKHSRETFPRILPLVQESNNIQSPETPNNMPMAFCSDVSNASTEIIQHGKRENENVATSVAKSQDIDEETRDIEHSGRILLMPSSCRQCTICSQPTSYSCLPYAHPLLGVLLCQDCYSCIIDKYPRQQRNLELRSKFCSWCNSGKNLIPCSTRKCPHMFCRACICCHAPDDQQSLSSGWKCFICNQNKLATLQRHCNAALQAFPKYYSTVAPKSELSDAAEPLNTSFQNMDSFCLKTASSSSKKQRNIISKKDKLVQSFGTKRLVNITHHRCDSLKHNLPRKGRKNHAKHHQSKKANHVSDKSSVARSSSSTTCASTKMPSSQLMKENPTILIEAFVNESMRTLEKVGIGSSLFSSLMKKFGNTNNHLDLSNHAMQSENELEGSTSNSPATTKAQELHKHNCRRDQNYKHNKIKHQLQSDDLCLTEERYSKRLTKLEDTVLNRFKKQRTSKFDGAKSDNASVCKQHVCHDTKSTEHGIFYTNVNVNNSIDDAPTLGLGKCTGNEIVSNVNQSKVSSSKVIAERNLIEEVLPDRELSEIMHIFENDSDTDKMTDPDEDDSGSDKEWTLPNTKRPKKLFSESNADIKDMSQFNLNSTSPSISTLIIPRANDNLRDVNWASTQCSICGASFDERLFPQAHDVLDVVICNKCEWQVRPFPLCFESDQYKERSEDVIESRSYLACTLCRDGGELICCSFCPHVFHMDCILSLLGNCIV